MSKSAKAYGAAVLAFIAFPLFVAFWSGTSAILAVLLIGLAAYALGVCFLIAAFWHRYRYGCWPIEIHGGAPVRRRFYFSTERHAEAGAAAPSPPAERDEEDITYRLSNVLQNWLKRSSSGV